MNWFQKWLNKQIVLTKIDAISLKPDQLLVFYFKGIKTLNERKFVEDLVGKTLKETKFKGDFFITNTEYLTKIDVIEKKDVKPDGTS